MTQSEIPKRIKPPWAARGQGNTYSCFWGGATRVNKTEAAAEEENEPDRQAMLEPEPEPGTELINMKHDNGRKRKD